ncbi:Undecaprenyl phosphate-alpha-4-amino-4-deoxy-L-arabinose arabinosyl transferase [subsurface metagenome]
MLFSAVTASWTLSEKTLDNHECLVSVTAREMLESSDWVWPTYNGEPRLHKTPLSYWMVAGLAKITGKVDEFTARMPNVIFAVLSIAAILYFVNQWLSFRIAVLSAAVWATSLGYIRYSHNARPEMVLTFFIAMCFLSFYSAITTRSRKRQVAYMLVFWTSFGVANLAKGPAPLPLVLMPLFFYVAVFRQWKQIPKLLPVIGTVVFLAIVLPWPLAIAHRLNWDLGVWKREFVDRFLGSYARGDYPLYYYLLIMFKYITPWVAFLPMALAAPFYRVWNKKQPAMKFLWLWFVVGLAFFTISGGKRQHYILPLMPAMAILIGILIEDMAFVRNAFTLKQAKGILRNHIVVIIAGTIALPIYIAATNSQLLADGIILSITTIAITAAVTILFAKRKRAFACGTVFAGIAILIMISYVSFINPLEKDRYSKDFAQKIAKTVPQNDRLIAYEFVSPKSVQYFGRVILETDDRTVLYEHYERGDWVLATAGHLEKLTQNGRFRKVYYTEKAERRKDGDAPGALFHKSAPKVKDGL